MSSYLVFARPGTAVPDEGSVVLNDSFAPLAFAFPVFWLLFNRLWLEALSAILILGVALLMVASASFYWPGVVLGLAVSLITGLEGRNWRASALLRRGWRFADLVEAGDAETAFDIHTARAGAAPEQSRRLRPALQAGRMEAGANGAIGLVPVERT
ncbi:DUF2628 domain-containing protein [Hoeflea sp. G2-23]|uniref:DUF2628 domain-containing protein n=1 Tax=Hoeflea algicola TaxID=2983763 RepID=A0ABT3ZBD4_9HYPH|nr:DUF2628 domain-containing protein [Hoeflea algicola]MCY0149072.1 DUF2628 domain-containing protein [Hoeflea algicola]